VIRTVWLGVFLLVGLAALASFKLAFSSQRPVTVMVTDRPQVASDLEIGTDAVPNTLNKSDRLKITYASTVESSEPVATVVQVVAPEPPVTAAPKITGRHWHDPADQRTSLTTAKKLKGSKKGLPAVEPKPIQDADACRSDGLARIKRLFNPGANCQITD